MSRSSLGNVTVPSISYTAQTVQIRVTSGAEIIYSPTGDPALDATLIKCRM